MNADDVRDFLEGFERISVQAACKQTRGRTVVVDVWFGKDGAWEQMEPSAVDRMWAGSSLCGFMLRDHFRLSDSEYASVMKDLNRSQGLPGIYQRGEHYVIVVKLPRRRSYEDMLLGGALAASAAVIGTAAVRQRGKTSDSLSQPQTNLGPSALQPARSVASAEEEKVSDLDLAQYGYTLQDFFKRYNEIHHRMLTLGFNRSESLEPPNDSSTLASDISTQFNKLKWGKNTALTYLKETIVEIGNRILVLNNLENAVRMLAQDPNINGMEAFKRASDEILNILDKKIASAGYLRLGDVDFKNMKNQVNDIVNARRIIENLLPGQAP